VDVAPPSSAYPSSQERLELNAWQSVSEAHVRKHAWPPASDPRAVQKAPDGHSATPVAEQLSTHCDVAMPMAPHAVFKLQPPSWHAGPMLVIDVVMDDVDEHARTTPVLVAHAIAKNAIVLFTLRRSSTSRAR
jgi:hypothetical protein